MKKWKCIVCSYIHTGDEPPEKCPVCGADKSMFVEVDEENEKKKNAAGEGADQLKTAAEKELQSDMGAKKWKCTICSYIHVGENPPETCPVCGAEKSAFVEISAEQKKEEAAPPEEKKSAPVPVPPQYTGFLGFIGKQIIRHHLHPISVHTPNGVLPVALVFLGLAMFFGVQSLEMASFFNLIFVLFSMPLVVFTGFMAWQIKYRGAKTSVFITKMICSAIVGILLGVLVCWRLIAPEIALSGGTGSWIYLTLALITLAAAGIAGHLGGKLVFSSSK